MKTHWISIRCGNIVFAILTVFLVLVCTGCEKDPVGSSEDTDTNILASEDHWVNPEGSSLIALDGSIFIDFSPGAVKTPTLITVALVAVDDDPMEEYNAMDQGLLITSSSKDLVFESPVNIRMNYALESFQGSARIDEKQLTIYKVESLGSLSERMVSIGQCCVDCSCKTVAGCINECGLYIVGELYVVVEYY
jgi:hypothetical protein